MEFKFCKWEVKDKIGYITITREEALNALNDLVIADLTECFKLVGKRDDVGVIIFTGAGRSFIAGADIAKMADLDGTEGRAFTKLGQDLMDFVEDFHLPVIAAVNGFALGGGCEFAMACDIRVASTKAKFGQPEVNLGIVPGFGGTQRLPRLIGKGMAKYMIYTGEMVDANEALRIGLVQKVVEPDQLMDECKRIADLINSKAPVAVRLAKCSVNIAENVDLKSGVMYETEAYDTTFHSADRVEGMKAFVEKRAATFQNR